MPNPEDLALGAEPSALDMNSAADDIANDTLPPGVEVQGDEGSGDSAEAKPLSPATPTKDGKGSTAPASSSPTTVGGGLPAPVAAPESLPDDVKAMWPTMDPKIQATIASQEAKFTQVREQMEKPAMVGEGFVKVLEPYLPTFQQYGTNPLTHVENLLHHHSVLMFGRPDQKAEIIAGLALDAGIDLRLLLTGQPSGSAANSAMEREVAALRAQIGNVNGRFLSQDQQHVMGELEKRWNDKENYPHFPEVAEAMVGLYKENPRLPFDRAYRIACADNPIVMDKMTAGKAEKILAEGRAKAEAARKARGTRPRSSSGVAPAPRGKSTFDVDDAVDSAAEELSSK